MAKVIWQIQTGSVKRDDRRGGFVMKIGFALSDGTVLQPRSIFVPHLSLAEMKACVDKVALKLEARNAPQGPQPTDELSEYEGKPFEVDIPVVPAVVEEPE